MAEVVRHLCDAHPPVRRSAFQTLKEVGWMFLRFPHGKNNVFPLEARLGNPLEQIGETLGFGLGSERDGKLRAGRCECKRCELSPRG